MSYEPATSFSLPAKRHCAAWRRVPTLPGPHDQTLAGWQSRTRMESSRVLSLHRIMDDILHRGNRTPIRWYFSWPSPACNAPGPAQVTASQRRRLGSQNAFVLGPPQLIFRENCDTERKREQFAV